MIKLEIISLRKIGDRVAPQFFNSDLGIKEYIKNNFQNSGKLISISSEVSEDYTTETKTLIFKSREDYDEFEKDKVLQYQNIIQERYSKYYGITFNKSISEL